MSTSTESARKLAVIYKGELAALAPVRVVEVNGHGPKLAKNETVLRTISIDIDGDPIDVRDSIYEAFPDTNKLGVLTLNLRAFKAAAKHLRVFERDENWTVFQHTAVATTEEKNYATFCDVVEEVIGPKAAAAQRKAFSAEGRAKWDAKNSKKKARIAEPKLEPLAPFKLPPAGKQMPIAELMAKTVVFVLTKNAIGNRRKVRPEDLGITDSKESVGITKKLLAADELDEIMSIYGEINQYVESHTMPGRHIKRGVYIVLAEKAEEIERKIMEFQERIRPLLETLVGKYDQLLVEADQRLSQVKVGKETYNLFNREDFLTVEELRAAFRVHWRWLAVDSSKNLTKEMYEREKARAQADWEETRAEWKQLLRAGMIEVIDHLRERLTPDKDGKDKTFRDTAVTNVTEFFSAFDSLNIENDQQLKAIAERGKEVLRGVDAETLRQSSNARDYVLNGFNEIKTVLDGMVINRPKRAIRFQ